MQPTPDPKSQNEGPLPLPRPGAGTESETVVREKSDDPAVIITRTGSSYNTRVITAAVVAIALVFVVWVVVHRRNAPGSNVSASGGEVAVDSSPISQREAAPGTPGATTPYWPSIPYANGPASSAPVITPSPYTTAPMQYPAYPAYTPMPPVATEPPPASVTPVPVPEPTSPRNSGAPATTPTQTVFPRLDSLLGIPVDSQGRARVPPRRDTVTHIDSVLRPPTKPGIPGTSKPVLPARVDSAQHGAAPPLGSTTRVDTSAALDSLSWRLDRR